MIIRMWHGRVDNDKASAYREFLKQRAIPRILERHEDDATHFITMTTWENLDDIKAFAGEDLEKAKYYPEDDGYLLEFEPTVVHYEVVGQS